MRTASTGIKTVCVILPLVLAYGCATDTGSTAPKPAPPPDKAEQALTTAQTAMQEARAARAAADAALAEARGNRARLPDESPTTTSRAHIPSEKVNR